MGSSFVIEGGPKEYAITGLDEAADEIWIPAQFAGVDIRSDVSFRKTTHAVPYWQRSYRNVRRIHIPEWVTSFDADNLLFPELEQICVDPRNPRLAGIGPLLLALEVPALKNVSLLRLQRVFSAGYRDHYTFPHLVHSVADFAFAVTTITDIEFLNPDIVFQPKAFASSWIERVIQERSEPFVLFGSLLYRCTYIKGGALRIPMQVRRIHKDAFADTRFIRDDGTVDQSPKEHFPIQILEAPYPFADNRMYAANHCHFARLPEISILCELHLYYYNITHLVVDEGDYESVDGVLFSKDKKQILFYPNGRKASIYTVPEGVERIGPHVFYRSALQYIQLPKSLRVIEPFGMYVDVQKPLKELSIPRKVEVIEGQSIRCEKIRCYEGTARGLFQGLCSRVYSTNGWATTVEIVRGNGEILTIFLPSSLHLDGFDVLDKAWNQPVFDVKAYQRCYEYIRDSGEKFRFAMQLYLQYGEASLSHAYFKRILVSFAKQLIKEKQCEELVSLLKLGLLKPKQLQSLLQYSEERDDAVARAYILELLNVTGGVRKSLRL